MTDEKICPIMSRPTNYGIGDFGHLERSRNVIDCQKDKCMAWRAPCKDKVCQDCVYYDIEDPTNCIGLTGSCDIIRREPDQ